MISMGRARRSSRWSSAGALLLIGLAVGVPGGQATVGAGRAGDGRMYQPRETWAARPLASRSSMVFRDMHARLGAEGTFAPSGPPVAPPKRVDAGGNCIVDLRQPYTVSGTLSGSFDIDYRILTYGPCPSGPPKPGTYAETWVAYGTFSGTYNGRAVSADFTYTAEVRRGGAVHGAIDLGGDLSGELTVTGSFSGGSLSYRGDVSAATGTSQPASASNAALRGSQTVDLTRVAKRRTSPARQRRTRSGYGSNLMRLFPLATASTLLSSCARRRDFSKRAARQGRHTASSSVLSIRT